MSVEPRLEKRPSPPLLCCGGAGAPEGVARGWAHLLAMHTSAQQEFVELLARSVLHPDDPALEAMLDRFCGSNGVEAAAAMGAIKACHFLLERSAALDLEPSQFAEDLKRLSGDDPAGVRLVGARYVPLKQHVREQLLERALTEHGKVLVGLDWRVDRIAASDHAANLNAPVVFLTLQLRDAEATQRVTMQLTSRSIQLLRQFCQRFDAVEQAGEA